MRYGWDDYSMMGGGYGGMMFVGWIIGLLILVLIVLAVIALIRYLQGSNSNNSNITGVYHAAPAANNALNILNERYARGEISDQEYAAKKAELRR